MSRIRWMAAGALVILSSLAAPASVPADAAVAPASTFTAQINGTDEAPPNTWCTWTGSASGGTPPYTFAWIAVGTGLYDENISGNTYEAIASHGAIDLWMTVRDSNGGYIELNKRIGISSYGSC
jgi:hypothetical protein